MLSSALLPKPKVETIKARFAKHYTQSIAKILGKALYDGFNLYLFTFGVHLNELRILFYGINKVYRMDCSG